MATGTPDISIPLYEIGSGGLSIPVSLSYHAGGIKVDEYASWVGLGWSLAAGGVITRSLRGLPDEDAEGFLDQGPNMPTSSQLSMADDDDTNFLLGVVENGLYDTQPDVFFFNFGSYSGRFYFNNDGKAYTIPYQPLEITLKDDTWFQVRTPDGTEYDFTATETTDLGARSEVLNYTSAWYLTSIKNPISDDLITFSYQSHNLGYSANQRLTLNYSYNKNLNNGSANGDELEYQYFYNTPILILNAKKLQYINFDNGRLHFVSSGGRSDVATDRKLNALVLEKNLGNDTYKEIRRFEFLYTYQADRLMLLSLQETAPGASKNSYRFEYSSKELPPQGSTAIDHWGYYNGKIDNVNLLPISIAPNGRSLGTADRSASYADVVANILTRISYPTGGTTEFAYEPHSTGSIGTIAVPVYDRFRYSVMSDLENNKYEDSRVFAVGRTPRPGSATLQVVYLSGQDRTYYRDEYAVSCTPQLQIRDVTADRTYEVSTNGSGIVAITLSTSTLPLIEGHTYEVKVREADFRCAYEPGVPRGVLDMQLTVLWEEDTGETELNTNEDIFKGVRIQKVITKSSSGATPTVKMYKYFDGRLINQPRYDATFTMRQNSGLCTTESYDMYQLTGSSMAALGSTNGSAVVYSKVEERHGQNAENGRRELFFTTDSDIELNTEVFTEVISQAGRRGRLTEEWIFDNDNMLLQKTVNRYKVDNRIRPVVRGLRAAWNTIYLDGPPTCQNQYISDQPFTYIDYNNTVNWEYIDQTTVTRYEGSSQIAQATNYFYDNPAHAQLSRVVTLDSEVNMRTTAYKYATDFPESSTTYGSNLLRDNHMHRQVLEQTTTVNEESNAVTTQKVTTTYNNPGGNIVPTLVRNYLTGTNEAVSTYYEYDNRGNVRQVLGQDGVPTAFIWGYNQTLPVAKIVGAEFSELEQISGFGTNFQAGAGSLTDSQAQTLRDALKPAQVIVYTHDPLVGITSETEPNGRKMIYHYDDLNRLQWIESDEGHVVQKVDYQYAQP